MAVSDEKNVLALLSDARILRCFSETQIQVKKGMQCLLEYTALLFEYCQQTLASMACRFQWLENLQQIGVPIR